MFLFPGHFGSFLSSSKKRQTGEFLAFVINCLFCRGMSIGFTSFDGVYKWFNVDWPSALSPNNLKTVVKTN